MSESELERTVRRINRDADDYRRFVSAPLKHPRPSRTAVVLAAILAFAAGSGFGAFVIGAGTAESKVRLERERTEAQVKVIQLETDNAILRSRMVRDR